MVDGRGVTAALDFLHPAPVAPTGDVSAVGEPVRTPLRLVRADRIPVQGSPALTVSLTQGCDVPLEALRAAAERTVSCHPCDEAVVALLVARVRRTGVPFSTNDDVSPGTLRIG